MQDPNLGPGRANKQDDFPRFGVAIKNEGRRIRKWCEEWVIDENAGWDEIVAKAEELIWLATVIYAASTRPGYKPYRMDFFLWVILVPPRPSGLIDVSGCTASLHRSSSSRRWKLSRPKDA